MRYIRPLLRRDWTGLHTAAEPSRGYDGLTRSRLR